jgi:hypothetical protein
LWLMTLNIFSCAFILLSCVCSSLCSFLTGSLYYFINEFWDLLFWKVVLQDIVLLVYSIYSSDLWICLCTFFWLALYLPRNQLIIMFLFFCIWWVVFLLLLLKYFYCHGFQDVSNTWIFLCRPTGFSWQFGFVDQLFSSNLGNF